ncbi:amidohydrolase family protein [Panacagrimonas sp.]|uniref:amidohydrolase family protein n=1 Tax=Panacagrimonas sp. TaxID=2480088 RepID=UPI003B52AA98
MTPHHDPDGLRLPIKLDSTTNGEFAPIPLNPVHRDANRSALQGATRNAQRLGLRRRDFLVSACGAATALLGLNAAYAAQGRRGGFYDLPPDAALDREVAEAALDKQEFIFDVQGHFVNPSGAWLQTLPEGARPLSGMGKAACTLADEPGERSYLQCLSGEEFVKDVFLDSDTDLMVLSFVPSTFEGEPLKMEEAHATARIVEKLRGTHRLYLHARVNPNLDGDVQRMDEMAERYPVAAWKTYTQWGADGRGFFLDDAPGIAMIERARKLGVRNIAVHKGIPFGRRSYEHSTCVDIGRVAKRYPDVNFLIYHAGFVPGAGEGPYDPQRSDGIDALVTSLKVNGIAPGGNVYPELGSTWRYLMRDPDAAAHALGKLIQACGPDNLLWGTDSIWYGSPQDQIQAFRTFQIAAELRERHGYAEITPELRAKVFGLNALKLYPVPDDVLEHHLQRDTIAGARQNYRNRPDPSFLTYGPRNRREFLNLRTWESG